LIYKPFGLEIKQVLTRFKNDFTQVIMWWRGMLREFRAKYASKLTEIKKKLIEKYPNKREQIENIADLIMTKLKRLRRYDIADYIFTLHDASKQFKEFEELIPPSEEIDSLLKKENQAE
jgi:DNA gyrase/topoisomerase IV subunit A